MTATIRLSVVVPAHNAAKYLARTLEAIAGSDLPREDWELIVVDDASKDDTVAVAARYADTVVRLPQRAYGPAYARNRGVEVAAGTSVAFIDADVVIRPETLRLFAEAVEAQHDVGAVFGSYDEEPADPGFVSQYRNLLHHYVHQKNPGDAETFWAGAGIVRKDVFVDAGMYDEWHYAKPQIEDIEMGGRIRRMGYRILLRPDIQVKHLKRWTLAGVLTTDLKDRGIPWARLLAHSGAAFGGGTLNVKAREKMITVLVWVGVGALLAGVVLRDQRALYLAAATLLLGALMNAPLLGFFARRRGVWFAMRVLPLHLLYYLLNGVSFGLGLVLNSLLGPPRPDPLVEAYAEIGLERWPPNPARNRSTWTGDKEHHG